jgi:excisionase family DNA binding protein
MRNGDDPQELLRVDQAGQLLKLSRAKVYQLMQAGQLEYVQLDGCRRIPRQALQELIERKTVRQ